MIEDSEIKELAFMLVQKGTFIPDNAKDINDKHIVSVGKLIKDYFPYVLGFQSKQDILDNNRCDLAAKKATRLEDMSVGNFLLMVNEHRAIYVILQRVLAELV